jgi:hypothetical protein
MMVEAREDMVAVLPNRFGYDHGGLGRDLLEDIDSIALAVNKSVSFVRLKGMSAIDLDSETGNGGYQRAFHSLLRRPTLLIGRQAQVPTGNQIHLLRHDRLGP